MNAIHTIDGNEILNATERIVTLLRDLTPKEIEAGTTLKKDNQCPGIFGSMFDNNAYEEWHPNYTFPYAYRRFVVIDGGWESRDVPGPSVESLPLEWGVKKGDHLIMVTRNRPWGDGGVSWGTKWRLPKTKVQVSAYSHAHLSQSVLPHSLTFCGIASPESEALAGGGWRVSND